ncbi:MAG: nucleoside triphosphate pyrophosphohydrolase [Clostridiales bacterium]|nr:nucleoside triphosphate pyrophosphohydrolase [Clostridiales bacterium]
MGTRVYRKLVRDNIPDIIKSDGDRAIVRRLSEGEYRAEFNRKLLEETNEYLAAGSMEELADIAEVIHAILALNGIGLDLFEEIRLRKRDKNGGFDNRLYLESVVSD